MGAAGRSAEQWLGKHGEVAPSVAKAVAAEQQQRGVFCWSIVRSEPEEGGNTCRGHLFHHRQQRDDPTPVLSACVASLWLRWPPA